MANYIRENNIEKLSIVDIYWDRIYLHIKLDGEDLENREYIIATEKNKIKYPVKLNPETNEIVINITNVHNRKMLSNNKWYIKYGNVNYEEEMGIYEEELEEYKEALKQEQSFDEPLEKPWRPFLWKDIPASLEVCRKMADLDKIYRYSGNNYAYVFSFYPVKRRERLICAIQSSYMMRNSQPSKRHFNIESTKPKVRNKKKFIYFLEKIFNFVYRIISALTPKNGKRILLMSETRDLGGNLKALDDRLKERGFDKKYKISYHFVKTLECSRSKIFFIWLKLVFLTARQDYIFVDDYVPFFKYIDLSPKTKLIQVWHAGVGFKSVGYARFGEKGSPYPFASCHRKYDYAIVGGEALRDVYAEVFGIDRENCLPFGLMRNDGYLDEQRIKDFRESFYNQYEYLKDKKIILFAPTFRGTGQRTAYYPYKVLEQDKIFDMCGEEYVFLIKMHPFIRKKIEIDEKYQSRIIDFSDFPDINSLFYVTDLLITDFSSNIYEFAMLKKPIISFAYDKDEYELIRSVHRTLDKYAPGKVCTTMDELVEAVKNKDFELDKLQKFIDENFDNTEGYAADKVIDFFFEN